MSCKPPSVQGFSAISSKEICEYEIITFEVDPTEDLIVYELVDQDGNAIGPAQLANGTTLNLETFPLTVADGVSSVQVKAQRIGVACDLTFGPAIDIVIKSLPKISLQNSALESCQGETSVELDYSIDSDFTAAAYNIDFDSASKNAGFVDISNNTNFANPISISIPEGIENGTYNAVFSITDSEGCTSLDEAFSIKVFSPEIGSISSNDPTTCGGVDGSIVIKGLMASEIYDNLFYTNNGSSVIHGSFTANADGEYEIAGLDAGSYESFQVEYNSCLSETYSSAVILTDPGTATIAYADHKDPTNCNVPNGEIVLSGVTTGNYTVSYNFSGNTITQSISAGSGGIIIQGLEPGNYRNISIINASNCTSNTIAGPISLVNAGTPEISLGANPSVLFGSTLAELNYSATTNNPDLYSIDFDASANAEGFIDVVDNSLSGTPIDLILPGDATAGTYSANLNVKNSSTGCSSTVYNFSIEIDENQAPEITNNAGAATYNIDYAENGTGNVIDWDATDAEGDVLTFSLSGTDNELFDLDATTGILNFKTSPDYEGSGDNEYVVVVTVSDGRLNDTQELTVTVTDVDEFSTFYADTDGDSFGDPLASVEAVSMPTGYVVDNTDCNDADANEFPGQTWYLDGDGDKYGVGTSVTACDRPANHFTTAELIATSGDCDDTKNSVYPGANETPSDGIDQDCDGVDLLIWYADIDKDSYGDPLNTTNSNTQPAGYVSDNTDCDDSDASINPDTLWYIGVDADADGYFGSVDSETQCTSPGADYSTAEPATDDCNDSDATINPETVWYVGVDADGDGYIGSVESETQCTSPGADYSMTEPVITDCDDADKNITPETFWFKGVDADGDGYIGSVDSETQCASPGIEYSNTAPAITDCDDTNSNVTPDTVWYKGIDADADGYFGSTESVTSCTSPGFDYSLTEPATNDCDDSNAMINPDTIWYIGVDADSDGYIGSIESETQCTSPGASYSMTEPAITDCDDTNSDVTPDTIWYKGIDADEDGYFGSTESITSCTSPGTDYSLTEPATDDCDDNDATINPETVWYVGVDADGDGYIGSVESETQCTSPGADYSMTEPVITDCDDADKNITPETFWFKGVDADGDGYIGSVDSETQCASPGIEYSNTAPAITDCDDTNSNVTPDTVWYKGIDADADGYFGSTESITSCTSPGSDYSLTEPATDDCNDTSATINPETIWYVGVDADGDGYIGSVNSETQCTSPGADYSTTAPATTDCDDTDENTTPNTVWYKGVDADADGYFGSTESVTSCTSPGSDYSLTEPATDDCDDSDAAINPDTVWYIGVDADGDGYVGSVESETQCTSPGADYLTNAPAITDCDDTNSEITPNTVWYKGVDADEDGYFGSTESVTSCTSPGSDYSLTEPATDDCDDSDAAINPDTVWYIGVDPDGDGYVGSVESETQCISPGAEYSMTSPAITDCDDTDENITPNTIWYKGVDADGDGYIGSVESETQCTSPGAEYSMTSPAITDCDDAEKNITPETLWYKGVDADEDGYFGSVESIKSCTNPGADYSLTEPVTDDCDDTDANINPETIWYLGVDADKDGYIGSVDSETQCNSPGAGYSMNEPAITDCDDTNSNENPDTVWFKGIDADSDGYFGSTESIKSCTNPGSDYNLTEPATNDCNDSDATINPDTVWYRGVDADKDGYFGSTESIKSCTSPGADYSLIEPAITDCDDSDTAVNPETIWYMGLDTDGDGYIGSVESETQCTSPGADYSTTAPVITDCDDSNSEITPNTVWYKGVDADGDGYIGSVDSEIQCTSPEAGYSMTEPAITDCDDTNSNVTPNIVWYKGVDADADGYFGYTESIVSCKSPGSDYSLTEPATNDCDDSDAAINPETLWYKGFDADADEYIGSVNSITQCTSPGSDYSITAPAITDCDDSNSEINPNTVWFKGVDADEDGYFGSVESITSCTSPGSNYSFNEPAIEDCDDTDAAINPETVWYIGVDADGDGYIGSVDSETLCTSPGAEYSMTSPAITDCDDTNSEITPETLWYKGVDADEDGYSGSVESITSCTNPGADYSLTEPATDDCNDSDATINPDTVWYKGIDADGDGYFGSVNSETQCTLPGVDYSTTAPAIIDCDDTNADINPNTVWFKGIDADDDGYFGSISSVTVCEKPGELFSLTAPQANDCDDSDDSINPGATEILDNDIDENCDGVKGITPFTDTEAVYTIMPAKEIGDYQIQDMLATVSDDDGSIVEAEISGGNLPEGMIMNDNGNLEVSDTEVLVVGEYSIEVTTTDEKGGVTTQTIILSILEDSDLDDDGLLNEEEEILGTDPQDADSDGDGLTDGEEVLVIDDPNTDLGPVEVSDPLNPCDPFQDGDSCDPDQDGLTNVEERSEGTDMNDPDSDNDGLTDGEEVNGIDDPATPVVASGVSDPLNQCDPNRNSSECFDNGPEIIQKLSPNGDGIHDYFEIKGIETFAENTLEIYNRWGVMVYEAKDYGDNSKLFRGISEGRLTVRKGEELPAGTYFYVLRYLDGEWKSKSGHLYLNR